MRRLDKRAARATLTAIGLISLVATLPAGAHLVGQRFGDYYGGLLHPLTALEHATAFLALALLAGQQTSSTARRVLIGFPIGLLLGSLLAPHLPQVAATVLVNRSSLVVLGLLVASARPLPSGLVIGIATLIGVSHGYENGLEITAALSPLLYSAGVASTGLVVVTLVSAASLHPRPAWVGIAVRVAGSWVAAIGLMMIALTISGRG